MKMNQYLSGIRMIRDGERFPYDGDYDFRKNEVLKEYVFTTDFDDADLYFNRDNTLDKLIQENSEMIDDKYYVLSHIQLLNIMDKLNSLIKNIYNISLKTGTSTLPEKAIYNTEEIRSTVKSIAYLASNPEAEMYLYTRLKY